MKVIIKMPILKWGLFVLTNLLLISCEDSFLKEKPLDFLSSDNVLTSKKGFENYIIALHDAARSELNKVDYNDGYINLQQGTDIACNGELALINYGNWTTYLTPSRPAVANYWNWAYIDMLLRANTVITYAQKPELSKIWANEAEKNAIIAEACFFRAYTHNFLANLYGGVPIVDTIYGGPKTDFVRNTRKEVYESARKDLEFAAQWLPDLVEKNKEGRIVKAAANHLLSEVYISLGEYDKAIQTASKIIDGGLYKLMTTRFGSEASKPGDVFSDMFRPGNQNRSSGNLESIYVWQFEDQTLGGQGGATEAGNPSLRYWGPFYVNVKDPAGFNQVVVDSLGRGVAGVRANTYFFYDLWKDNWNNDMRNSSHNIRRVHYYNNPASPWYGKVIEEAHKAKIDTFRMLFPRIRKVEGNISWKGATSAVNRGYTTNDFIVYRLAETYLLRAEAYMYKGDLIKAAADINKVRARANAKPVESSNVTLDYILDERARELVTEEPRHRTLVRTGKLVERVRKYNMREDTRTSIKDFHQFWPIPQSAIDANFSTKLTQNPGY
ncbi:RagB/SusD family nutrient uptake outer membrane protein [Runella zeae]|uniref:RagB/SusD family nutrient uptake outer membrane protein n=1 Tax=Runella zeae TaxID=94255 RepID=UPI0023529D51|nr:RagB/SusD family nutrient uptake outer membrane protein [Runella zeae]